MHYAAYNGYLATAKRLLEGGAAPTLRNKGGNTALDLARSQGKSDVVALLSEPRYTPRGTQSDRCMMASDFHAEAVSAVLGARGPRIFGRSPNEWRRAAMG